jgi:hypothetical protein
MATLGSCTRPFGGLECAFGRLSRTLRSQGGGLRRSQGGGLRRSQGGGLRRGFDLPDRFLSRRGGLQRIICDLRRIAGHDGVPCRSPPVREKIGGGVAPLRFAFHVRSLVSLKRHADTPLEEAAIAARRPAFA